MTTIEVRSLRNLLREVHAKEGGIDLVKMDCEGCEYSLLTLSNDDIRLVKQWIIEVHGSEAPIIDKMTECGYSHKRVKRFTEFLSLHWFYT